MFGEMSESPNIKKRIGLVEPFYSGSHQQWADDYRKYSNHEIELFTLPGRHWKWRMHGAAISHARQISESEGSFDYLLCSDMIDVALFRSQLLFYNIQIPIVLYFHENQLNYPWSPTDQDLSLNRDRHYAWINYTSALSADKILFNSSYHYHAFLKALPGFLQDFPDARNMETLEAIESRSDVCHLGLDLKALHELEKDYTYESPVLLWNHRWEYDKNPESFFLLCRQLKANGHAFRIIVCGETSKTYPAIFDVAETEFQEEIIHWGYAESRLEYHQLLNEADIIPVTSNQDFFGGSVVEAIAAGCVPVVPRRLAFPEHLPERHRHELSYETDDELYELTVNVMDSLPIHEFGVLRDFVLKYDWQEMAPTYDKVFL